MERSLEPKRKGKEFREKEPTPGTQEFYKKLREDEGIRLPSPEDEDDV